MTEIKKITKISLLAYGIVNIIYGPIALFLPDFFINLGVITSATNPYTLRFGGATLLGIAIFAFLILIKKEWEWEKIKLAYEFLYYLLIANIILEPTKLAFGTPSSMMIFQTIMDIIIMVALLVLGVYSYIKQRE
ncbi:MAG: hypothetical protein JSV62_15950 [Promethearchaeota archaeon]|nr:MAG: hypothetical protein JSV62_15950 [Candidatus Lokiarchaeota archaeon]